MTAKTWFHESSASLCVSYHLEGPVMSVLDTFVERNKEFAAKQSAAGTLMPSLPGAMPNVRAMVIGCADMRVDPAHVLGIAPGEAVVIRNIGGRVTPGLLQQLGLLGKIGEVAGKN